MSVEIVGMIGAAPDKKSSSTSQVGVIGSGIDGDYIANFAQAHDNSGFDKVLVGYTSTSADGFIVAMHAAAHTKNVGFLIAHRPGFVSPTLLARKAATFDQLTKGRIAIHIISGGSDDQQMMDGDFIDKPSRYQRSGEFMHILKKIWTGTSPFDYEGRHYQFKQAISTIECYQEPRIPLYFGGSSEAALDVGARECDVYATFGEPLIEVKKKINDFRDRAKRIGRDPSEIKFSVSTRPIVADTESEAWDKAYAVLHSVQNNGVNESMGNVSGPSSIGSKRLVEFAQKGSVQDKRLFMPIAEATGGSGNSTALVGTADQVAEALLEYYKLGATTLLVRGFDPINDAEYWGRELIPLLREKVHNYLKNKVNFYVRS
jgi:alkanesulfonate monooxygenase